MNQVFHIVDRHTDQHRGRVSAADKEAALSTWDTGSQRHWVIQKKDDPVWYRTSVGVSYWGEYKDALRFNAEEKTRATLPDTGQWVNDTGTRYIALTEDEYRTRRTWMTIG